MAHDKNYDDLVIVVREVHALLFAIGAGGMFDAAPLGEDDRRLQACGSELICMAEMRLQRLPDREGV